MPNLIAREPHIHAVCSNMSTCSVMYADVFRLVGYVDAYRAGDLDERKSTFGYVFLLNNNAIT